MHSLAAGRRIIRSKAVLERVGFKDRSTLWRKVKHGEFPPPVALGNGRIGWYEDLVDAWVNSRPQVSWAPGSPAEAA